MTTCFYWMAAAAVLAAVASCSHTEQGEPVTVRKISWQPGPETDLASVAPAQRVFRTSADWAEFFRANRLGRAPEVDFSAETAIAVFAGARPQPGYSVDISRVVRLRSGGPERVRVHVTERVPKPGTPAAAEVVFPYALAAVPIVGEQPFLFCSCQQFHEE